MNLGAGRRDRSPLADNGGTAVDACGGSRAAFAATAAPPLARGCREGGCSAEGRAGGDHLAPKRLGSAFLWGTMLHTIGLRSIGAPRTKTSASSRRIRARRTYVRQVYREGKEKFVAIGRAGSNPL